LSEDLLAIDIDTYAHEALHAKGVVLKHCTGRELAMPVAIPPTPIRENGAKNAKQLAVPRCETVSNTFLAMKGTVEMGVSWEDLIRSLGHS